MEVKTARKRSMDPAQEHLREQKAIWNRSTTDLIAKMIAFKRGLNGRGDPQAGLPPSSIKDPLPSQIGSYLDQIANEYMTLVSGAEKIITEQDNYSKVRRKSQPKLPQEPEPTSNPLNEIFPAAADDGLVVTEDDPMVVQASWFGSRWWHTRGLPDADKKYIRDMLRASEAFKDRLLDVENYLSSSDPNAVAEVVHIASSFGIGAWKTIMENFNFLGKVHGKVALPKPKEEPKPEADVPVGPVVAPPEESQTVPEPIAAPPSVESNPVQVLKEIYRDRLNLQSVLKHLLDPSTKSPASSTDDSWKNEVRSLRSNLVKGNKFAEYIGKANTGEPFSPKELENIESIIYAYRKLLTLAAGVYGFAADSFAPFAEKIQSGLTVKAHNYLSRLLKKKWLDMKPDFFRNDIALDMRKNICIEHIENTIKAVDSFMRVLESKPTVDNIFAALQSFSNSLGRLLEDVITLAEYHNSNFRHEFRAKNKNNKVVHHQILEREINKLRKARIGILELSSTILVYNPSYWGTNWTQ